MVKATVPNTENCRFESDTAHHSRGDSSSVRALVKDRKIGSREVGSSTLPTRTTITPGDKLYIVIRNDLTPGLQIAQACHGIRQFSEDHPTIDAEWFTKSNYVAALNASEQQISDLIQKSVQHNIAFSTFRENDLDDEITVLVLAPGDASRKICSCLPLALRNMSH